MALAQMVDRKWGISPVQQNMKTAAHTALLRSLPELYREQTLDSLPRCMLDFLSQLVPADALAYNEVNLKQPCLVVTSTPPELSKSEFVKRLALYIQHHPIVQHQRRTGDTTARKISDFVSKAQYHELPVYREVYRHLGAEDQFALALRVSGDTIIALALNRDRRNFTEEDRELLNLTQRHLVQAYRNAEVVTQLRHELAKTRNIVETLPMGLIILDSRLGITFSTRRARKLLLAYFPGNQSAGTLPEALRFWLLQKRKWRGRALPNVTDSFTLEAPAGTLLVRSAPDGGRGKTTLLLEERPAMRSPESLQQLGLTRREAEVLLWVARGKSNPEIAIILRTASRTVQKHLEHVFSKLGVASRTDAARRALEFFSPDLRSV